MSQNLFVLAGLLGGTPLFFYSVGFLTDEFVEPTGKSILGYVLYTVSAFAVYLGGISLADRPFVAYLVANVLLLFAIPFLPHLPFAKEPKRGATDADADKSCEKCGFSVNSNARFCPNCGYALGGTRVY